VYTTDGQGIPGYPSVNIYAKKGDNYIHLLAWVFTPDKIEKDLKDKCGFTLGNLEFPESCWKELVNSSEYKNAAKLKAEELIKTFAL
jgi:hypothetical protein